VGTQAAKSAVFGGPLGRMPEKLLAWRVSILMTWLNGEPSGDEPAS